MSNQSSPNSNVSPTRLSVSNIWKMHEGSVHLLIPTAAPILLSNNSNNTANNINVNNPISNNFANNSVNTPNQIPQVVHKNSSGSININVNNMTAQGNNSRSNTAAINNSSVDATSTIKKPPNAFMLYSNDMRTKLKTELPDAKQGELVKIIGARWKACHPDEKAKYAQKAAELLAEWKTKHPGWEEALKQKRQESAAKSKKRRAEAMSSDLLSDHNTTETAVQEPAHKKRKVDSSRSVSTTKSSLTTASLKDSLMAANGILNNISLFLTSRNQSIPIARASFDEEDSQSQDSCQIDASRKSSLYTNPITRCFDEDQASDSSNEVLNDNSAQYVDTRAD